MSNRSLSVNICWLREFVSSMLSNHLIFIWFPTSLDYWEILTWPGLKKCLLQLTVTFPRMPQSGPFGFMRQSHKLCYSESASPSQVISGLPNSRCWGPNCVCCWNHEWEHHILGFCLGGEGATYSHPPGLLLVVLIQTCLLPTVSTAAASRKAHLQACGSHACPFRRE